MEYKSIKGFTGWGQLGFLLAFLGLGIILQLGVQLLFAVQMLPVEKSIMDSEALLKAMTMPENVGMARAMQVISTFVVMFIPAILWNIICNGRNMLWLGFSKHINVFQILLGFMIIFSASIASSLLADLSKNVIAYFPRINALAIKLENLYNEQALALSNLKNIKEYIIALFIMAFFPAMFEEVFFRGTLQNLLIKWLNKPFVAIIITSLVFSLIHFSIYLFLSRAVLGFALGLMYYKTKNIWVNIIAHFLNNAIVLSMLYKMQHDTGKLDIDKLEPNLPRIYSFVAAFLLIGLFLLLTKYSEKNKKIIEGDERLLIPNTDPLDSFAHNLNN